MNSIVITGSADMVSRSMPPPIVNQGIRRAISVASILRQARGNNEEVAKCLLQKMVDSFNSGGPGEFSEIHFHCDRRRCQGSTLPRTNAI